MHLKIIRAEHNIKEGTKNMNNKRKQIIIAAAGIILLGSIGYVAALNGWFGGGDNVPSDTMTRGLVSYWAFNDGNGTTVKDLSENSNNGTLVNGPVWVKGKIDGALKFDGNNDYANIGNIGSVQTLEFWLNDSNASDGVLELVDNTNYISISGGSISLTGFNNSTVYINGIVTTTLSSGWNNIIITADAISASSFKIGEANNDYFNGTIDEMRVYNRTLTAAEAAYHYNAKKPVINFDFNEGAGTVVHDLEGNLDINFPDDPNARPAWSNP